MGTEERYGKSQRLKMSSDIICTTIIYITYFPFIQNVCNDTLNWQTMASHCETSNNTINFGYRISFILFNNS